MKKYDVIGLMSGTSLDGLDIAFVRFKFDGTWSFDLMECESIAYNSDLVKMLKHANELSGLELKKLDLNYGQWIGEKTKSFMDSRQISPELIVSHGHTIFHQPEIGLTHQIGDGYRIMVQTGVKTICDLRSLDLALGGQGAPLVPIGDQLLFHNFEICLNLGGFSNVSFDREGERIAYDICPVNTVLNHLAAHKNLEYDAGGQLARSGKLNAQILQQLNDLDYYQKKAPKSLGIEWVNEYIFPILNNDTPENLLNTFCQHIARQIFDSIDTNFNLKNRKSAPKMLVTGGGAKNNYLIELLNTTSKGKIEVYIPDMRTIDFKEAIIFAYLGLLRSEKKINTLRSVTGAIIDSSGGIIYDLPRSK